MKDEIDERRGEEDEARQSVKEVGHRVEVAETLRQRESAYEERVIDAQDLDHTTCPTDALLDVSAEAFGGETCGLRDVDVGSIPAVDLHAERGVRVFGDGFHGDAADLV